MSHFHLNLDQIADHTIWASLDEKSMIQSTSLPPALKNLLELQKNSTYAPSPLTKKVVHLQIPTRNLEDFNSFTKNLPQSHALLEKFTESYQTLGCDLEEGNWDKIIQDYQTNPDQLAINGLKIFHLKVISSGQFSTLITLWSLLKELPGVTIKTASLFQENSKAFFTDCVVKTFLNNSYIRWTPPAHFLKRMEAQPKSEQVFFYVPIDELQAHPKTGEAHDQLVTEVIAKTGIRVFYQLTKDGITYRMIPSFSVMQQYLYAQAGPNAVKLNPVFGISEVTALVENGKIDQRDLAHTFIDLDLPKTADKRTAPYYIDFRHHDFYHAVIASQIPSVLRKAFVEIAELALELKSEFQDPFIHQYLHSYYEQLVDMEHPAFKDPNYTKHENPNNAIKFLFSLDDSHEQTVIKISQHLFENHSSDLYMLIQFETELKLHASKLMHAFAKLLEERKFLQKLAISHRDLEETLPLIEEKRVKKRQQFENILKQKKNPNIETKISRKLKEYIQCLLEEDTMSLPLQLFRFQNQSTSQ